MTKLKDSVPSVKYNTIRVIAFDWDGTLFDSMGVKIKNLSQILSAEYGVDAKIVEKKYRELSGVPRELLIRRLVAECDGSELSDRAYREISERFTKANISTLRNRSLFGEVKVVIPKLAERYILYISSASVPEELEAVVGSQKIDRYFRGVWGSEDGFSKGKEHFSSMEKQNGCSPMDILFVGDDSADGDLAAEHGTPFLRILRDPIKYAGFPRPCIQSLSDLELRILDNEVIEGRV